jgi:mono/diheme cytochrome c family protein
MNLRGRVALAMVLTAGVWRTLSAAGDATSGAAVYKASRCSMCHQIAGAGGKMGGSLDAVGSKRDAEILRKIVKDPKAVDPKSRMKAYPSLSEKEMDDLVAYLLTLKSPPDKK